MTRAPDSWLLFSDRAFGFEFSYPPAGGDGAAVTVREDERSGRRRVHISTEDARDVYFELEQVDRRTVDEGLDELATDLRSRFPAADFGLLERATLAGQPARSTRFTFGDRERLAIFAEHPSPAHRVILDPRSATNLAILATLAARG